MTDKKYPLVLMETFQRGKGVYRDSESIDDMIHNLGAQIAYLEDLQELGVELELNNSGVEDDYITLAVEVEENSEKFKQLVDSGFMKIDFDDEGERI